jgi:hypothetical protein
VSRGHRGRKSESESDGAAEGAEIAFFDCFLADGDSCSSNDMVFYIIPTGEEKSELSIGFSTIRIEHRTSDGQRLCLSDIDDSKPRFNKAGNERNASSKNVVENKDDSGAREQRGAQVLAVSRKSSRVAFVGRSTGHEAIVVRPIAHAEAMTLEGVQSFLEVITLYGQ